MLDLQQRFDKARRTIMKKMRHTQELKIYVGETLVGWDWTEPVEPLTAKAKNFWIQHGAMRSEVGKVIGIKRTGYALEDSLRSCGLPCHSDIVFKVQYPSDNVIVEGTDNEFELKGAT